jgi:hypothetical protein
MSEGDFERDGYLVFDPGIPVGTIDGAVADLFVDGRRGLLGRLGIGSPAVAAEGEPRVQDAWRVSDNVKAIARAPAVLELLGELFGRKPRPFQTLNFRIGTEQAPHSDTIHFNSKPAGFMCGVWVALEDIDSENGPLVYYPASHRLPEVTMSEVGVEAAAEHYPSYEAYIGEMIERRGLEARQATIGKGQALVWAANLLHGGAPQHDPARTRLSQVTHYFFEGCRYWTPLLSDESDTAWREPDWVE